MEFKKCFRCMRNVETYPCSHCGYDPRQDGYQAYALRPGSILNGKYVVGTILGQGGFGITYVGWDLALDDKVAVKEYFPSGQVGRDVTSGTLQWYSTPQAEAARESGKDMFLKEARKMSRVRNIAQVVHIRDLFQQNDTAYIVMDFVDGQTLKAYLNQTGPLNWETAKAIFFPAIRGMEQVHKAGLIHRDLSPDNIMLMPDGSVKILDLGAAKDMNVSSGASSMQVAKSGFSPLEQYTQRGGSGTWTDVYSMAATMYYSMTGVLPTPVMDRMEEDQMRWDLEPLKALPKPVLEALQKAMVIFPKNRTQTIGEFLRQLDVPTHEKPDFSFFPKKQPEPVLPPQPPKPQPEPILPPRPPKPQPEPVLPPQPPKPQPEPVLPPQPPKPQPEPVLPPQPPKPQPEPVLPPQPPKPVPPLEENKKVSTAPVSKKVPKSKEKPAPAPKPDKPPVKEKPAPVKEPPKPKSKPAPAPPAPKPEKKAPQSPPASPAKSQKKKSPLPIVAGCAVAGIGLVCVLLIPKKESAPQLEAPASSSVVQTTPAETILPDVTEATVAYTIPETEEPTQATEAPVILSIPLQPLSTSAGLTLGLQDNGTVLAIGSNDAEQLNVSSWQNIVAVSAGYAHSVGLKNDGTVLAVGSNDDKQCNVSGWRNIVAITSGKYHTVGLDVDGNVWATGRDKVHQCAVSDWSNIIAVSAGAYHTVGLKADGTVVATGSNTVGQCEVGSWTDIVAIAAGDSHTVGLKADGTVIAVGGDTNSKARDVSGWYNIVAICAGSDHTVGLKADGTMVATGSTKDGQCKVTAWRDIVAIYAGGNHTIGLKKDGTIVFTGDNESGQCNVADWGSICLPDQSSLS